MNEAIIHIDAGSTTSNSSYPSTSPLEFLYPSNFVVFLLKFCISALSQEHQNAKAEQQAMSDYHQDTSVLAGLSDDDYLHWTTLVLATFWLSTSVRIQSSPSSGCFCTSNSVEYIYLDAQPKILKGY